MDSDFELAMQITQSESQVPPTALATTSCSHISGDAISSMHRIPSNTKCRTRITRTGIPLK